MSDPIRVLIGDDHQMLRHALESWLAQWCEVIPGASTLSELDAAMARGGIDVAIIDLSWGDEGSATVRLPQWYKRHPTCRVIILTAHDDWHLGQALVREGARGFLGKRSDFSEVLEAIRVVASGGTYFGRDILPLPKRSASLVAPALPSITFRIVEMLAHGYSRKAIAKALNVSVKSVDYHIARVKALYGIGRWQRANWKMICATLSSLLCTPFREAVSVSR